jgi:hypothetical protein
MGKFEKGHPKLSGPRGPGKLTDLKNSIIAVYDKLGGTDGLFDWVNSSKRNQDKFYTLIMTKVIPKEIKGDMDGTIKVLIEKMITIEKPKNDRN